jgi:hypothetical protein
MFQKSDDKTAIICDSDHDEMRKTRSAVAVTTDICRNLTEINFSFCFIHRRTYKIKDQL